MPSPAVAIDYQKLLILSRRVTRLRMWALLFIGPWLGGLAAFFIAYDMKEPRYWLIGTLLLLVSLIPYVAATAYAYLVQKQLNDLNLYKPGAWQVIVGALLLNPWFIGIWIPLSVASTASKIRRQLGAPR